MPATVRSRPSRPADASSGGTPKPRTDAYVGLLVISLLAQIAGAVFLYLEYSSYPGDKKPPAGPGQADDHLPGWSRRSGRPGWQPSDGG